jgi:hypothetical protein
MSLPRLPPGSLALAGVGSGTFVISDAGVGSGVGSGTFGGRQWDIRDFRRDLRRLGDLSSIRSEGGRHPVMRRSAGSVRENLGRSRPSRSVRAGRRISPVVGPPAGLDRCHRRARPLPGPTGRRGRGDRHADRTERRAERSGLCPSRAQGRPEPDGSSSGSHGRRGGSRGAAPGHQFAAPATSSCSRRVSHCPKWGQAVRSRGRPMSSARSGPATFSSYSGAR